MSATATAPEGYSLATLTDWIGHECGVSDWVTLDHQRVLQFAECTGDHQWIHVDVERCRNESPFQVPIAHGFLTLSLLAPMVMNMGVIPKDCDRAINAGVTNVRFLAPVRVDRRVRARVTLREVARKSSGGTLAILHCVMDIDGEDKPALQADMSVMLFGEA